MLTHLKIISHFFSRWTWKIMNLITIGGRYCHNIQNVVCCTGTLQQLPRPGEGQVLKGQYIGQKATCELGVVLPSSNTYSILIISFQNIPRSNSNYPYSKTLKMQKCENMENAWKISYYRNSLQKTEVVYYQETKGRGELL